MEKLVEGKGSRQEMCCRGNGSGACVFFSIIGSRYVKANGYTLLGGY